MSTTNSNNLSKTRQSILNKIKYLKQHKEELVRYVNPHCAEGYAKNHNSFIQEVKRNEFINENVAFIQLTSEHSVEYLKQILEDVESQTDEELHFTITPYEEFGSTMYEFDFFIYRKEFDDEYNQRLSQLVQHVEEKLEAVKFPKKRSGDPELDAYIKMLEEGSRMNYFKWLICWFNRKHIFTYFIKQGKSCRICVRCGCIREELKL